ncbi:hypothetical protein ACIU1J_00810 [Azospirillum doebereinerae]|uniref:hypothetical protein n=1 Tax=Azospirillum doebereinerae TaxID=92933 RepID=UPI001EE5A30C|nr:hypothetical protein [Azospirillum doebereinerae]MCG5239248.1 hypothetical protein [Azospirillum doebereinerae]
MDPRQPGLLAAPFSPRPVIEAFYMDVLVREGLPTGTGFSLALPKGWALERTRPAVAPGPDAPIVSLARFYPGEPDALGAREDVELIVWAAFLPREIHGADWLRAWIASQGYRALESRQALSPTGIMGDTLAARRHNGGVRLHRLFTVKDGDLLFLIDGRIPQGPQTDHRAMQEIFLLAAMRFRLAEPTGQSFAEGFEWTELKGEATVRFRSSGLWTPRPAGDAPPGGAAALLDNGVGDAKLGTLVAVLGVAGDPVAELERTTLAKLANQDFVLSPERELMSEDRSEGRSVTVHRRAATRAGTPLVVLSALVTLATPGGTLPVCLMLVTPDEATAFEAWAINRRAFEIAVNSLQ